MKLSEAIRKGAEMVPGQAFGSFKRDDGTACAMWAARKASGLSACGWMAVNNGIRICAPDKPEGLKYDLVSVVIYCNDRLRWNFWQIADWVELQEKEAGLE